MEMWQNVTKWYLRKIKVTGVYRKSGWQRLSWSRQSQSTFPAVYMMTLHFPVSPLARWGCVTEFEPVESQWKRCALLPSLARPLNCDPVHSLPHLLVRSKRSDRELQNSEATSYEEPGSLNDHVDQSPPPRPQLCNSLGFLRVRNKYQLC